MKSKSSATGSKNRKSHSPDRKSAATEAQYKRIVDLQKTLGDESDLRAGMNYGEAECLIKSLVRKIKKAGLGKPMEVPTAAVPADCGKASLMGKPSYGKPATPDADQPAKSAATPKAVVVVVSRKKPTAKKKDEDGKEIPATFTVSAEELIRFVNAIRVQTNVVGDRPLAEDARACARANGIALAASHVILSTVERFRKRGGKPTENVRLPFGII